MWHDHPFSQRNKTTETAVRWGLEEARKGKGVGQNLKKKKKKKKKTMGIDNVTSSTQNRGS